MDLSEQFFEPSSDLNDVSCDQVHRLFYDNKSTFKYNMTSLQTL